MTQLEYLLTEYGFRLSTNKPKTTVEEIETKIGFALPEDYKFYVENYCGRAGMIGPEYAHIWDVDEILDHNRGYQIFDFLPLTLAIGTNGGGDFIAIEYIEDGRYRIVISPFIDLDKQYHIEIGKSFTDFFGRLYECKGWFG